MGQALTQTLDFLERLTPEELVEIRDRSAALIVARDREPRALPAIARRIVDVAAADGGIAVAELLSTGRRQLYAKPRQRAMASVRALRLPNGRPRFSWVRIGMMFRRDYTTVQHAAAITPEEMIIRVETCAL
jgi:chromosomal replication initiation ATPase DnaA